MPAVPVGVPSDAAPNSNNHKNFYKEVKKNSTRLDRLERGSIRSGSVGGEGLRFFDPDVPTNGGTTTRIGSYEDAYFDPEQPVGEQWVSSVIRGISIYEPTDNVPWFSAGSAGTKQTFNVGFSGNTVESVLLQALYTLIASDLDTGAQIEILSNGDLVFSRVGSNIRFPDVTTIGAGDILVLDGDVLKVVSSSVRYKQDIEDAVINPEDVLLMQGRTWRDRGEVEQNPETQRRFVGFIAEELAEIPSLRQFVRFNSEDEPESIYYDRLVVGVVELVKTQQDELNSLKTQVQELSEKLIELQNMVESIS
jgi:hypothetical protein